MRLLRYVLMLGLCIQLIDAQGIGIGRRKGSGARLEAPYTFTVETPHVKWANPLLGGPIRLLAVPTVSEGRTLVELAQRLSLDLTTVSIDPRFDANKWTMGFGRDYGARAEKGDLGLLVSYLEEELTSGKHFDVILLPLHHGWERLTPASREALARRVREGAGLVLIRPFDTELSPLTPVAPVVLPADASEPVEPGQRESSAWRAAADHYITRAIPVESFPFQHLENYLYRAAPDATVLLRSEAGNPVLAVRQHGKGRVAAFAYRNAGLIWYMPMTARGFVSDAYWEYFYSMLCRALIYTARREPAGPPDFTAAAAAWRLKDESGAVRASGKGRPPEFKQLPPGRYFLEQQTAEDWKISALDIGKREELADLRVSHEVIAEGDSVEVTWRAAHPATIEIIDGLGRVIARATGSGRVVLKAGRPLVHSGFVTAAAGSAAAKMAVQFAASSREWTDYEVIMPWYGPPSCQPWIPALDEQFRKIGLTVLAQPERNFKVMASAGLHDEFGVYGYRSDNYQKRKALYAETKDKKYLTRDVVLQDPGFEAQVKEKLERLRPLSRLGPIAYYLADESSLTSYTDAFDVDWSPAALDGFRRWLQREYSGLDSLNASWDTGFKRWEDVVPMTTEEAQQHGNYAPWADHRAYMEDTFVRALARTREMVQAIDPGAIASLSGTQIPTAHNGVNWYRINQFMDYLQPYSGGNQDAMHHLFRPGIRLSGFTGYGRTGDVLKHEQWQRLFYGHTGASIFWHYTILNPDLSMSEQGRDLADVFGRIQSGIGRVFMNSTVRENGVGIHFSMASIRGAWIQDGQIRPTVGNVMGTSKNYAELMARRSQWVRRLESLGVQFRFVATEQIETGELDKLRVLILPYSIALSDSEIRAIQRFIDRGGIVYGDEQTGRMDERCRWRKAELKGVRLAESFSLPPEMKAPLAVPEDALLTVRDFGQSRLIGLLPRSEVKVSAPAASGVTYDLVRGAVAAAQVEAGPGAPALFLQRPSRIASIEIASDLNVRLTDEAGKPVDLSVVRMEVFDPNGRLVRHYSSNITIADGKGRFEIPFALNDPAGRWRVVVRDVVSGLTAERGVEAPGSVAAAAPLSRIAIDAGTRSEHPISRYLFGKFTEHLWWNVYNGLWAQVLKNPSFESWELMGEGWERIYSWAGEHQAQFPQLNLKKPPRRDVAPWWVPWGKAKVDYALDADAFNSERCQRISSASVAGGAGIEQPIYLPLHREDTYDLVFYAKGQARLRVSVQAPERELASARGFVDSGGWRRYPLVLDVARSGVARGTPLLLRIELAEPGSVWVDQITLFPRDTIEGFDADIVRLLRDSKLPLLRFPGGNFVSGYHWQDGIGPVEKRPTKRNPAWGDLEPNHVGTDEYMTLCRLVGCDLLVCVNAGNGTAQEAADWVEYCNGSEHTKFGALRARHGHKEPYGVRLWEIGNELYGEWQIGHCTSEEYAERYAAFHKAMHAVDPGIHFLAIGQNQKWVAPLLEKQASIVQTLALHELRGGSSPVDASPEGVFEELMAFPVSFRGRIHGLADMMRRAGVKPSLAITEAQIFTRSQNLPTSASLAEALYLAGLIHVSIREGDLAGIITHSALVNHGGGLRKQRESVFASPVHYASVLYGTQSGMYPVRVDLQAAEYTSPGRYLSETKGVQVPILDPVALLSTDGRELTVITINRSPNTPVTASIDLRGFPASGHVRTRTVTGESYMTRNTLDQPEAVRLVHGTAEQKGGKLTYKFPQHSLVELVFTRAK